MTHTYHISGMTCSGCEAKVKSVLSKVKGVKNVRIDLPLETAIIEMTSHVDTSSLQHALKDHPKYQLTEKNVSHHPDEMEPIDNGNRNWFETYKPILLIFVYITAVTLLVQLFSNQPDFDSWMQHFMAGFFLVFSFFKLLDLQGFADSYSTYDIIAKKWRAWGYIYAFIELALGFAFLTGFSPLLTNGVTFVVMSVSIIGVLQSVLNKRKIKCACLGAVFNLPMSTVTIIEDLLMIGMSGIMLAKILL